MMMLTRTHVLIAVAFLAPVLTVLVINRDTIRDQMTPRPENGYLIYATANR